MSEFEKTEALWDTENGMENRKAIHTEVQVEEVTEEATDDFEIPDIPAVFPTPESMAQEAISGSGEKGQPQPAEEAHVWNSKTAKQQVKEAKRKYRQEKKRLRKEKRMRGPGWRKVLVTGLVSALIGGLAGSLITLGMLTVTNQVFHIDLLDLKPEQIEVIREQYIAQIQEYKSPGTAVYKKNCNSVAYVKTSGGKTDSVWEPQGVESSAASGIVYREDGYVLTNISAIRNALNSDGTLQENASIMVYLPQKTEEPYQASVVGYDLETDVALLHIEATQLYAVEVGDSAQIQYGETVFAMSYDNVPGTLSIEEGMVRNLQSEFLEIDRPTTQEWRNRPLFSTEGQFIGMNSTNTDGDGTFAVPSNQIVQVCNRIIEEDKK